MKVAFLDRDGVINNEVNYLHKIEDFQYTNGCIDGLKKLRALGYQIIIVTNQAGIARGFYSEDDYQKLTDWYMNDLRSKGIDILDSFYCPHYPEGNVPEYTKVCECRKPKSGMFFDANNKYEIDVAHSIMIGDKISDIEAAINFGLIADRCYLVKTGHLIHKSKVSKVKLFDNINQLAMNLNP